jgi:hypothetical protein
MTHLTWESSTDEIVSGDNTSRIEMRLPIPWFYC